MIKQTPSWKGITAMIAFALSCFGILLWLWISFGGPSPLKPQSYRFKANFPESSLLVNNADVRISGLTVGKVATKTLNKDGGGQVVEMDIDHQYAPIPLNTKAILRAKSILGQIYIELTPGDPNGPKLPDGGTLRETQVQDAVFVDEIIRTFDKPTRRNFQGWLRELATTIDGRSEDLNLALANLDRFAASGSDVLEVLDEQNPALERLIRNGSIVLGAINERQGQFRELIGNANNFFGALASRNERLAETIDVLPTFLDESKATLTRLEQFAGNARPLVRDLAPVAVKLRPTVEDLGALAPDLKKLFVNLDPLIEESDKTLPEAAKFLKGAEPVLEALHVYLPQLNPILSYLNYQQAQVADFFMNGSSSTRATLVNLPGEGPRHYLRQYTFINSRSQGIATSRSDFDRGNAYLAPNWYTRKKAFGIGESWDCKYTQDKGEVKEPENNYPPCFVQPPLTWDGKRFPHLDEGGELREPPKGSDGTKPASIGG